MNTECLTRPDSLLDAALSYAEAGWQVLPCHPKTKRPITIHGLKDASADKEQIRRWWRAYPEANVAIRCGQISAGLVVIDVDGEEGNGSLKGKPLPPTVMARTGGGGWHYLYYYPHKLRPKVGLLPKVDLRAEDSYIVAPPSIHPSGTAYEWIVSPSDASTAPLPEWVPAMVEQPVYAAEISQAPTGKPDPNRIGKAALLFVAEGAPKGKQRLTAVAAARNFTSAGYPVDEVAKRLWQGFQACEQDGDEPWTFEEAEKIAHDIASKPAPPMPQMVAPFQKPQSNGKRPMPEISSAAELLGKDFPPLRFLVPGLWPEGTSLLVARPKIGKTMLALNIAIAIASGGIAMGSLKVDQGEVLYLAFEDGERRMQGRLRSILGEAPPPENLYFAYKWLRVNEGGIENLQDWLVVHPNTRLIVVDTLRKLRPRERVGGSVYNADYDAVAPLTDLAHAYNTSIWMVSHQNKRIAEDWLDTISGSTGLPAAVDHAVLLVRERSQVQGIMKMTSRDMGEQELGLEWQPPHWVLVGTAREAKQSRERQDICDVIRLFDKPMSPSEIALALEKNVSTVKGLLQKMCLEGVVASTGHGCYEVFPRANDEKKAQNVVSVVSVNSVVPVVSVVQSGQTQSTRDYKDYDIHMREKAKKAIDTEMCHCGAPVYSYLGDGTALCAHHTLTRVVDEGVAGA